jgi:hypothetical protein
MRVFALAGFWALLLVGPAASQVLRRDITFKNQCGPDGRCQKVSTQLWNVIDPTSRTIMRCDTRGCDSYPAQFIKSGVYTNIEVPARSMLAKVGDAGSFLEVVTLTDSVLVSFGSCRPQ